MNTEAWQESNNRYLAASLQWLRLRLRRLAPDAPLPPFSDSGLASSMGVPDLEPPGLFRRWFGGRHPEVGELKLLSEGTKRSLDDRVAEAVAERAAAAEIDPPPALLLLATRLGLSEFERDTLLLSAAPEFDPAIASLCGLAQGGSSRQWPTFGLALMALDEPSWDVMSSHRPLRYLRLLEINQPGGVPLTASPLRADERIVNFLKGLNALDDRLATLLELVEEGVGDRLAESQRGAVETILRHLGETAADAEVPLVELLGMDDGSKLAVAAGVCAALNRRLYRLSAGTIPTQVADVETLGRLWQRETCLLPVALYVAAGAMEGLSSETRTAVQRLLSRGMGLVFLELRDAPVRTSGARLSVEVRRPTPTEQFGVWTRWLRGPEAEPDPGTTAALLAGQFNLNVGEMREVLFHASKAPPASGPLRQRLWDACRDLTRPNLDALAQRLEVKATWDDLILPEEQTSLMRRIAAQVRDRHKVYDEWGFSGKMNRGFGISALFAGESGTGKTMAAEVIANALRLNLYRIDLSAVVSKYIGETEKNLRQLFDAAEQGGAILFFDEADALFGKRSEVKDSHDRYANIEINYLLQRMEAFSGLAILATNMKSAIDPAFLRRVRFVVNVPFPGIRERRLMWAKALPAETPQRDLDLERLARLNLAGGNIHSIALNAAFAAAADGQAVTMQLLLAAARVELRKLEKPFNEAELR